jgi:hypothetical protein
MEAAVSPSRTVYTEITGDGPAVGDNACCIVGVGVSRSLDEAPLQPPKIAVLIKTSGTTNGPASTARESTDASGDSRHILQTTDAYPT